MASSASATGRVPLESVITTRELSRRPSRPPDHAAVNRALARLSHEMANSPRSILQKLVETALVLCRAHSAGLSLLEEENGAKIFRWRSLAGEYAPHLGGTTPREFSPCGTVLDTNSLQLMSYLDRHFEYFAQVPPRITEALLVPFHIDGQAVGTIWVVSHDDRRQFDAEDARIVSSLGEFAASAYIVACSVNAVKESRAGLEKINGDLVRSNEALQAEIIERRRTELELKQANIDLRQFAFTASHDLQEPLRTIGAFAECVRKRTHEQLDPETEELLQSIVGGAHRMKTLVDGVLRYSQVGGIEPALVTVDLQHPLTFAIQDLQALISEHRAQITHQPLPTVYADETQLRQLFQNLISNAIKYRRPGEAPRIHVSAERGSEQWTISVRDNGQGFETKHAEQIFHLFKRLHGRDVPGVGIGLALCQKIVERHGGRIWATSEPGTGSTFLFTLPTTEFDVFEGFETHHPVSEPGLSNMNGHAGNLAHSIDRRAKSRYPIECELEYHVLRSLKSRKPISTNTGNTIDFSSDGVLFYTQEPLCLGAAIQVILNWPATLDGRIPLRLYILGNVVRSDRDRAAVRIVSHEFRLARPKESATGLGH
jgi:signal transduction histidine kinase